MTMKVRRLNHAVLRVRDLERSQAFYSDVLGFETVARAGNVMAFMRAPEVDEIEALREARDELERRGAISGASDHGATKSIYGFDPDGNEFEVMWMVPRERWGEFEHTAPTRALDLDAEIERWSTRLA
jgi:catechol-2,3-dioxygenase